MSDTNEPNVEEIKERLKIEIPVEEEETTNAEESAQSDIMDELNRMGQQFADALQSAWNSEERAKFETEVREGIRTFANEVDKAIHSVREGSAGQKLRQDAEGMRQRINADDVTEKARTGFVQGLRWLSEEMGKLAEQFTPPATATSTEAEPTEKSPEDIA